MIFQILVIVLLVLVLGHLGTIARNQGVVAKAQSKWHADLIRQIKKMESK